MRKNKHAVRLLFFLVLALTFFTPGFYRNSCEVLAAGTKSGKTSSEIRPKSTWVKKDGCWYFYNRKGKKLKGLQKIGKKYYYFDSKGVQLTGWRKIEGSYYFFRIKSGRKGWMVTGDTVNGIHLRKDGTAKVGKKSKKRKAELLVNYQLWAEELTEPGMSKTEKLRVCFDHLRRDLRYLGSIHLDIRKRDFDVEGAEFIYETQRFFECHTIACAFAYLANAIGYRKVQICAHSGHGWTEINGIIYDTSLARHNKEGYRYFASTERDGQEWPKDVVKDLRY